MTAECHLSKNIRLFSYFRISFIQLESDDDESIPQPSATSSPSSWSLWNSVDPKFMVKLSRILSNTHSF